MNSSLYELALMRNITEIHFMSTFLWGDSYKFAFLLAAFRCVLPKVYALSNWKLTCFLFMMNFHFFQVFGSWNKADGSTECYCSILAFSRNFRLHHGDLQWQDRNSDDKYDVCFKGNSPRTLKHQEYYILPPRSLS